MAQPLYDSLYPSVCSWENLWCAFLRARKGKIQKLDVLKFENDLKSNLLQLQNELLLHAYQPQSLETFIIRDPKIRKISKSAFRDRVVHHALHAILEPIYEKIFIYDSYANRRGKGTLKAIERFEEFKRKVTRNNTQNAFILKADIKHYFDMVDQATLMTIVKKKIKDRHIIGLITVILHNFNAAEEGKGMPLGNLTSQFFANVYLNELDQFVKHALKAQYYIRYVDDFVILHPDKETLQDYMQKIYYFLSNYLQLELHPSKSKIRGVGQGTTFLGFRIYNHHRLLKKSNIHRMDQKLAMAKESFDQGVLDYNHIYASVEGWLAYAHHASTYMLRKRITGKFEFLFPNSIADVEISRGRKLLASASPIPQN